MIQVCLVNCRSPTCKRVGSLASEGTAGGEVVHPHGSMEFGRRLQHCETLSGCVWHWCWFHKMSSPGSKYNVLCYFEKQTETSIRKKMSCPPLKRQSEVQVTKDQSTSPQSLGKLWAKSSWRFTWSFGGWVEGAFLRSWYWGQHCTTSSLMPSMTRWRASSASSQMAPNWEG